MELSWNSCMAIQVISFHRLPFYCWFKLVNVCLIPVKIRKRKSSLPVSYWASYSPTLCFLYNLFFWFKLLWNKQWAGFWMPQLLNCYWIQASVITPVAAVIMLCTWHDFLSEWHHQHTALHEMSGTNLFGYWLVHHCPSEWLHQHTAPHEMSGTNLCGYCYIHNYLHIQ
jgi:hypothetical protein